MSRWQTPPEFDPAPGGWVNRNLAIYRFGRRGQLPVSAQTFTNGGDVPWPFDRLLRRDDERFLAEFWLHDELCRQADNGELSRVLADALFYDAMKAAGAPMWRVKVMYQAVRFWALLKTLGLRR